MSEYENCVANATQFSDNIMFKQGIGWRAIYDRLRKIPGISERTIQEDLAALKASVLNHSGLASELDPGGDDESAAWVF